MKLQQFENYLNNYVLIRASFRVSKDEESNFVIKEFFENDFFIIGGYCDEEDIFNDLIEYECVKSFFDSEGLYECAILLSSHEMEDDSGRDYYEIEEVDIYNFIALEEINPCIEVDNDLGDLPF